MQNAHQSNGIEFMCECTQQLSKQSYAHIQYFYYCKHTCLYVVLTARDIN